jgi:hypothetical protein
MGLPLGRVSDQRPAVKAIGASGEFPIPYP